MADGRGDRLKLLIALEIDRIVRDLDERVEFLVGLWSRQRSRAPFRDTLFNRWRTLGFTDLAELEPEVVVGVHAFYEELERLRLYLEHTEDMPMTLREVLTQRIARLWNLAQPTIDKLGGVPEIARPSSDGSGLLGAPGEEA